MSTDTEALFDEIIGNAIRERADKEAAAQAARDAEDQKYRDAMAPILDAFKEIIRTRKPRSLDREQLKLEDADGYTSRSTIAFVIHRNHAKYFIRADWSPEASFRVIRNKMNGYAMSEELIEEFFDNWREAYRRTLEHLAPHVAYCETEEPE